MLAQTDRHYNNQQLHHQLDIEEFILKLESKKNPKNNRKKKEPSNK